jgi:uncharacterized membrane protein
MLFDPMHPALVHVPLGLALAMPLVAGGLALAIWRGLLPRRAWLVAASLQLLLVAGGAAAYLAGEREERRVERVVGKELIESHEDRAEAFLWAAGAVLAVALAGLALPERRVPAAAAVATAGAIAVAALGVWTGKAGGELVYRHGAASAYSGATPTAGADRASAETRGRRRD